MPRMKNAKSNYENISVRIFAILAAFFVVGGMAAPAPAEAQAIPGKGLSSSTVPVSFSPRIVGGNSIPITDAPWQVAIVDRSSISNYQGQFCGGSLISSEWIVTAAHCVVSGSAISSPSSIGIQVGNASLSTTSLSVLAVSEIRVHPSYSSSGTRHDIALIKLSRPVTSSSSVAPIAINRSAVTHGTSALVTGWGQTGRTNDNQVVVGTYNFPVSLQGATVFVSDANCWGAAPLGFDSSTMLCGGTNAGDPPWQKDTCQGDSGGPLAISVSGTNYLAGITSWGVGCAWTSPGVYTKVSTYASWIDLYVPAPPANFTLSPNPSISGLAVVGQTLTANTGEWSPSPNFAYQWFAGSSSISRAKTSSYVVKKADVNKRISVRVIATRNGYVETAKESEPTELVASSVPFSATDIPTISGAPVVGETLTASNGVWNPSPRFTYQWLANNSPIRNATASSYVLTASDLGKTISIRLTAAYSGYTTTTVISDSTSPVASGTSFTSISAPTITGTAVIGETLTAEIGSWTPTPSFRYQWFSNGRAITGATSSNLIVTRAYRGRTITVQVTGTLSGYAPTSRTSNAVAIPSR